MKIFNQIVLHIGSHKTGSTSIQEFMMSHKDYLIDYDYICKTKNGKDRLDGNSYFLLLRENWYSDKRSFSIDVETLLSGIKSSNKKNVIVSSESLSWVTDKVQLSNLKEKLYEIAEVVRVICYIREPVSYGLSIYCEATKPLNCLSVLHNYNYPPLKSSVLDDEFKLRYYSFENLLPWNEVFSDNLFVCRWFDKRYFYKNNLISDFLHIIGIDDIELYDLARKFQIKNQSLSLLQMRYLELLRQFSRLFSVRVQSFIETVAYSQIKDLECNRTFFAKDEDIESFADIISQKSSVVFEKLGMKLIDFKEYSKSNSVKLGLKDYMRLGQYFLKHMCLIFLYASKKIFKIKII